MEYYNTYSEDYERTLKSTNRHYKLKLELLSYYENVVGEIVKDISTTAQGQINKTSEPLRRSSCTLTLINVDNKYTPNQNSWFWFDRKFKLWIGLVCGEDIYWWAQGVYLTQNVSGDNSSMTITGVDKGGLLDGTLKTGMFDNPVLIEAGSKIPDIIKSTLWMNSGATPYMTDINNSFSVSQPIDPVAPIIDTVYNNVSIEADISFDNTVYIGELLTQIASNYGAEIYYNNNGNLVFAHLGEGDMLNEYKLMPSQWHFNFDKDLGYSVGSIEFNFDGINAVTVYTNAVSEDIENVSYTAYNNNPLSPLRVSNINIRRMEAQEMSYTETSAESMLKKCKQYADYLLFRESFVKMSTPFNSYIIPHLQTNKPITITNRYQNLDSQIFLVESYTMPLGAGEMSIQATNLQWLPTDTNIEGIEVG